MKLKMRILLLIISAVQASLLFSSVEVHKNFLQKRLKSLKREIKLGNIIIINLKDDSLRISSAFSQIRAIRFRGPSHVRYDNIVSSMETKAGDKWVVYQAAKAWDAKTADSLQSFIKHAGVEGAVSFTIDYSEQVTRLCNRLMFHLQVWITGVCLLLLIITLLDTIFAHSKISEVVISAENPPENMCPNQCWESEVAYFAFQVGPDRRAMLPFECSAANNMELVERIVSQFVAMYPPRHASDTRHLLQFPDLVVSDK